MTTKEQIKAEIERRMNDNLTAEKRCKTGHFGAAAKEDYEIVGIIDSIPDEPSENIGQLESEDLEQEVDKYFFNYSDPKTGEKIDKKNCWLNNEQAHDFALYIAEWQREQFEKNRLAACDAQTEEEYEREMAFATGIIEKEHRTPTFSDAINYGMRVQKEQFLTWLDIKKIILLDRQVFDEWDKEGKDLAEMGEQPIFEEVLRRFNERRTDK